MKREMQNTILDALTRNLEILAQEGSATPITLAGEAHLVINRRDLEHMFHAVAANLTQSLEAQSCQ